MFLRNFEAHTLHAFKLRDHIRMAWLYLRQDGWEQGSAQIRTGIQQFALAHHATSLYHETITRFWAYMVQNALEQNPAASEFSDFEVRHPHLFDKTLIAQFYSSDLLYSPAARQAWVEPDIQPLPALRNQ
jgi:hypothetical protein